MGCCLTNPTVYVNPIFGLVAENTCKTIELCKTNYTLVLVAGVVDRLVFVVINKTVDMVLAPCELPPPKCND